MYLADSAFRTHRADKAAWVPRTVAADVLFSGRFDNIDPRPLKCSANGPIRLHSLLCLHVLSNQAAGTVHPVIRIEIMLYYQRLQNKMFCFAGPDSPARVLQSSPSAHQAHCYCRDPGKGRPAFALGLPGLWRFVSG